MKVLCGACEKAPAVVFCTAVNEAYCGACDKSKGEAGEGEEKLRLDAIATKKDESSGNGLCDLCQQSQGYFFCREDRALMCRGCDKAVHTKGKARSHERLLVPGVKIPPVEAPMNDVARGGVDKQRGTSNGAGPSKNGTGQGSMQPIMPPMSLVNGSVGNGGSNSMHHRATLHHHHQQQQQQHSISRGLYMTQQAPTHPGAGGSMLPPPSMRTPHHHPGMMAPHTSHYSGGMGGGAGMPRQASLTDNLNLDELLGLPGLADNGYSIGDVMVPKADAPDADLFECLGGFNDADLLVPGYDPNATGQLGPRGYSLNDDMGRERSRSGDDDAMVPDMGAPTASRSGKRQRTSSGLGLRQSLATSGRR